MMMSKCYLITVKQNLARNEIAIQERNVQKEQLLASKCVKEIEKKHQ